MLHSWLYSLEYSFAVFISLQSLGVDLLGTDNLFAIFWTITDWEVKGPLFLELFSLSGSDFECGGGAFSKPLSTAVFFSWSFSWMVDTVLSSKRLGFFGIAPTESELGCSLIWPRDKNSRVEGNAKANDFLSAWELCTFSNRGFYRYSFSSITDFAGRQASSLIAEIRKEHASVIESSSLSLRFLVVRDGE